MKRDVLGWRGKYCGYWGMQTMGEKRRGVLRVRKGKKGCVFG